MLAVYWALVLQESHARHAACDGDWTSKEVYIRSSMMCLQPFDPSCAGEAWPEDSQVYDENNDAWNRGIG